MESIFKIGDRIRDIEDGDFYYEGIVIGFENNEPIYKVDKVVLVDEIKNDDLIGEEITPRLWYTKLIE